jgi:hypothetical protein
MERDLVNKPAMQSKTFLGFLLGLITTALLACLAMLLQIGDGTLAVALTNVTVITGGFVGFNRDHDKKVRIAMVNSQTTYPIE